MVDHLALSIGSTGARTGVDTLLLDTGHGQRTLRAEQTLWPAVGRTSEISLQTGTDRSGSFRAALTVGTTGVWSAGISLDGSHRSLSAGGEGISDVALGTATDGVVSHHVTPGVDTTDSDTGVGTLQVDAGQAGGALAVDHTLGAAAGRGTEVSSQTGTDGVVAVNSAVGVGSTGGGSAGVHWLGHRSSLGCEGTLDEGVSDVALVTFTDGVVVGHSTAGVDTTGAGAGVDTLGVDTGLVLGTVIAQQTLRSALHCGISLVVPDTLAHCLATLNPAVSVDTAGVGVAGISGDGRYRSHGLGHTPREGVSHSSRGTTTDGVVLSDLTHGAHSTGPRAGVDTLLGDAGQPGAAVGVLETLCLTALAGDRVSLVARPAGTEDLASSVLTALSVGAAGRGLAGVGRDAALEWIPSEAGVAPAVLSDVVNQTLGVVSTGPGLAQRHYGRLRPDWNTALDGVDGLCVAGPAGTPLDVVHHHTLSVGSAGVGLAGLDRADTGDGWRVSFISRQTETHRAVRDHPAAGVGPALVSATLGAVVDTADEGVASLTPGTGTDGVAIVQLTHGVDTTG